MRPHEWRLRVYISVSSMSPPMWIKPALPLWRAFFRSSSGRPTRHEVVTTHFPHHSFKEVMMENVAYQRGSSGRTFQGSVTREKTGWKSGGQCAEWQRCELWPRLPRPAPGRLPERPTRIIFFRRSPPRPPPKPSKTVTIRCLLYSNMFRLFVCIDQTERFWFDAL